MTQLTTQQVAELLVGIARSQQAVIDAIESSKPGFKMTHLAPVLQTVAKIRNTGHVPTLGDLPARVLLACQGRAGPDAESIAREIELIVAQGSAPGPSGA